jgi:hypothetical protein
MTTHEEEEEAHALRVRIWVTFVIVLATVGMMVMPEGSPWFNFLASMFWIWRK